MSPQPPISISVVTVSFNSGAALASCVHSVLASSEPVEVVVVDNGSTDDGVARLRASLPADERRVLVLENGRNLGFARANNRALPHTSGEFLLFLNPDCVIRPDTLARMRAAMEAHQQAGMAGARILDPDGSEQAGCRRDSPTPGKAFVRAFGLGRSFVRTGDPLPDRPTPVDAISGAFMFVRRAALEGVGPLDEGYFLHCEDLDWCERFRRAGWTVLFVPDVAVTHDQGGSSRARPLRVLWHKHRGMVRFYRKFFRRAYPLPLMWLVFAGVWLRFLALAPLALARGAAGVRGRR